MDSTMGSIVAAEKPRTVSDSKIWDSQILARVRDVAARPAAELAVRQGVVWCL
jgi:hypothetical protein